jgi:hypothetical protein
MAKCTKRPKCSKGACDFKGLSSILKFLRSPDFFKYYLLIFIVFVIMRLFKINYVTGLKGVGCNSIFFLWALLQFLALYVIILITFIILRLLQRALVLLIKWIQNVIKIKKNQTVLQSIKNNIIRIFFIFLIMVILYLVKIVVNFYLFLLYWSFGIFMGYTIIGRNNECINKTKK